MSVLRTHALEQKSKNCPVLVASNRTGTDYSFKVRLVVCRTGYFGKVAWFYS